MSNKERKHGIGTEQQYETSKKGSQPSRPDSNANRGGTPEQHREAGKKGGAASHGGKK